MRVRFFWDTRISFDMKTGRLETLKKFPLISNQVVLICLCFIVSLHLESKYKSVSEVREITNERYYAYFYTASTA